MEHESTQKTPFFKALNHTRKRLLKKGLKYLVLLVIDVWFVTVGMVSKPVTDQTQEFQIQQEDFPALPGATSK